MVTRIDRLARSVADLEAIVTRVSERGAFLRSTEQPIDTATPDGKAFLQMLGSSLSLRPLSVGSL